MGLGVVGAAALVYAYLSLNSIVRAAILYWGPKLTHTTIGLSRVSLVPFAGKGSIQGLTVGNPKGFAAEAALRVGRASLALEPRSLLGSTVHIERIEIDEPEIWFEMGAAGSNLGKLQERIAASSAHQENEHGASSGREKKVIIDVFVVRGAKAHLNLPFLKDKLTTVTLPEIELKGIGGESKGVSVAEAANRMTSAVLSAVTKVATNPMGVVGGGVKGVGEGLLNQVKGGFGIFGR